MVNRNNVNQTGHFQPAEEFIEFCQQDTEQSIAARFADQAKKYPLKTAVRATDKRITYQQLDQTSSQLANAMLARWGSETMPVAVLLPQSIESITAMLAVFKAGFILIPLDPTAPTDRDRQLLINARVGHAVTRSTYLEQFVNPENRSLDILDIDSIDGDTPASLPSIDIDPDSPALILYTSGSTGQPKGAVHSNRTVLHNVLRHTNAFYISHRDRQTQLYQVNAYAAMRDTLNALLNGASLHLYSVRDLGIADLGTWLQKEKITLYCSAASVFRHLAHTLTDSCRFTELRLIKLGGEITYKTDFQLFQAHFPAPCQLHCGFGSTETCLTRHYFADSTMHINSHAVPLGYACEDMEVQILNENRQPLPAGETGEIAVKSRYVALGYWQQEELSAAAFIQDENDRLVRTYLTGDMGYIEPDGCLVHQGRRDFQVKIRGNRVDVVEIEQALIALEYIREAAVVVRKNSLGENEMVAFCVCAGGKQVESTLIRKALSEKIPAYMIPASYVYPEKLPLTQSGKLNRKLLQETCQRQSVAKEPTPPQSPIEIEIAEIWKTLLQIDSDIDIHDNFFGSGGHSLLATSLISRINDHFNISMPMHSVFDTPDISRLSMLVLKELSRENG